MHYQLSPSAQKVLNATKEGHFIWNVEAAQIAAAALRAAAYECKPKVPWTELGAETFEAYEAFGQQVVCDRLLLIADELDNEQQ